ncbi:hypothetical protein H6F47_16560 [Sphaerospermopsis sp. FACHB-1094]|uniref:hypothetical protein n=1 Tax=Sphaerospermopsis sp. FACHB-1094 TaxID=2692861 RepID=UPI001683D420|nr:hypothetical protein [Sphaerospermopsis sp. FACHB-1094]MBD2134000.1 hypothetical protein [Sphaerospermopsis sp. FACHB-1094]
MLTSSKLLLIHKKFIGLIKRIRYICVRFTKRIILNCLQMLPFATLSGIENLILSLRICLQESIRIKQTPLKSSNLPVIQSYNEDEKLSISILDRNAPWHSTSLKQDVKIPGMITLSEKQYYLYLGRFYSGFGSIIELGPWLGLSTYYLVSSLLNNPNFKSQKIDVYDDFIWRSSWMDKWLIDV